MGIKREVEELTILELLDLLQERCVHEYIDNHELLDKIVEVEQLILEEENS